MEEIDVWRTAHVVIKQYGEGATFFAAQRAEALLGQGDLLGHSIWLKVIKAIDDLKRMKPHEGERVN